MYCISICIEMTFLKTTYSVDNKFRTRPIVHLFFKNHFFSVKRIKTGIRSRSNRTIFISAFDPMSRVYIIKNAGRRGEGGDEGRIAVESHARRGS
jgi:hypothetical protein